MKTLITLTINNENIYKNTYTHLIQKNLNKFIELQCKIFSYSLFLIPNYFDTLQFESNTLHPKPAPCDAIMIHTLFQAQYPKTI
jgi:hypothetical protein